MEDAAKMSLTHTLLVCIGLPEELLAIAIFMCLCTYRNTVDSSTKKQKVHNYFVISRQMAEIQPFFKDYSHKVGKILQPYQFPSKLPSCMQELSSVLKLINKKIKRVEVLVHSH